MSKAELLLSKDFQAYRLEEVKEASNVAREFVNGNRSPDYVKGAMEMVRRILLIPKDRDRFPMTDKQAEQMQTQVDKEFDEFHFQMVRRFMEVES